MGNLFSCLRKKSVDVAAVAEVRNAATPQKSRESLSEKMKRQAGMFTASTFAEVEPMQIDQEGQGRRLKNLSSPRDTKITTTRRKVSKLDLSFPFHSKFFTQTVDPTHQLRTTAFEKAVGKPNRNAIIRMKEISKMLN